MTWYYLCCSIGVQVFHGFTMIALHSVSVIKVITNEITDLRQLERPVSC